ncbi:MAG: radical SAM protein [Candidatus Omnitrophica bacterium]|nr:radical SAM protein [Candidatus Omnitrophota bacterium]
MKTLLVYPPRSTPVLGMGEDKLGLLYMAAVLRENNVEVQVYDKAEHSTFADLKKVIMAYRPEIVGVSISTPNRFDGFRVARLAKDISKKIQVIAGGPHVSAVPEDTLKNIKDIDVAVIGEGENTLLDICKKKSDINGIALREGKKVIKKPPQKRIENLNSIPFPARNLLLRYQMKQMNSYYFTIDIPGKGKAKYYYTTINTGRGCPYSCIFCAVPEIWGKQVRLRSAENVVEEMRKLKYDFNVEGVHFCDDTFNITKKRVYDMCSLMIKEKINLKWNAHLRVDNADKEMLSLMKDAGCFMISFGIESGSQRVLDEVIEKKITLDSARKCIRWCDELGIIRSCNFIYSLPGESKEDFHKTKAIMNEFGGKQTCGPTMILPASRIERIAKKKGVLPKDFSWSKKTFYKYYDPTSYSFLPLYVENLSWVEILDIFYNHINSQSHARKMNYIFRLFYRLLQIRSFGELRFVVVTYWHLVHIFLRNSLIKR